MYDEEDGGAQSCPGRKWEVGERHQGWSPNWRVKETGYVVSRPLGIKCFECGKLGLIVANWIRAKYALDAIRVGIFRGILQRLSRVMGLSIMRRQDDIIWPLICGPEEVTIPGLLKRPKVVRFDLMTKPPMHSKGYKFHEQIARVTIYLWDMRYQRDAIVESGASISMVGVR